MKKPTKADKGTGVRRRRRNVATADWTSAEGGLLRRLIATVSTNGGALRFGYSRDGGAYALGIYGDGDPFTEYLPGTEDVDEWLEGLCLDYE